MPYEYMNKDFLKEIFKGEKSLLKKSHIMFIETPKYDEISVRNLYDKLIKLDGMSQHFPTKYAKGRQCDRDYMFNIANTLHPNVVSELISTAHKHRFDISGEKMKQEQIVLSSEWADELKSLPYFSKVSYIASAEYLFRKKERWLLSSSRRAR